MKIIPAIDLMDGKVVRLYKGDPKNKTIYSENPIETAKNWESAFASRAVIGTIAMQLKESEQDEILGDFINTFGNERIVISIDHIDGKIVTHGWQTNTGIDLYDATNEFVKYGFTEFLTTNVSKDGTLEGPDIYSLKKICQIENCNVIASGGISKMQDVADVNQINPFGVILGKALYEGLVSIEEAKKIGSN